MALRQIGGDWVVHVDASVLIVAAVAALVAELPTAAFDVIADRILGQIDFSPNSFNPVDRRDLHKPESIATDLGVLPNRLYVADTEKSGILARRNASAFTSGAFSQTRWSGSPISVREVQVAAGVHGHSNWAVKRSTTQWIRR